MIRFPSHWSFIDKNRKPRRRLIAGAIALPLAVAGVTCIAYLNKDETLDTRPILPGLLAEGAAAPRPTALPSPTPASTTPVTAAHPVARIPFAVTAALRLPAEDQDDALATALKAWAAREPDQALGYARSLRIPNRANAIRAVLETLGHNPSLALQAGRRLLTEEPDQADDYGATLITALNQAGQFTTALDLANSTGAERTRTDWTAAIVATWVRTQPEAALRIAAVVSRPGVPEQVFQAMVEGWATSAPAALANFALTLPPGETRRSVLSRALESWVTQDPKSASETIHTRLKDAPEFGQALATLLTRSDRVFCPPPIAFDWTSDIADADLRMSTRAALMKTWAESDREAALNYLKAAKSVAPEERGQLYATLTSTPPRPPD